MSVALENEIFTAPEPDEGVPSPGSGAVPPEEALLILESHAHGIMTRTHRRVLQRVRDHASGQQRIQRCDRPHTHPTRAMIPCMVCAVSAPGIDPVSGSVILTLLERRNHDEDWNCSDEVMLSDVLSAVERARPTPARLNDIFGDYWPVVLCLAYRVQTARGPELASLLRAAVTYPDRLPQERDRTISSRWLVSQALSHKPAATIVARDNRRKVLGPLQNMATTLHLEGYPESEQLDAWLCNVVPSLIPNQAASPW